MVKLISLKLKTLFYMTKLYSLAAGLLAMLPLLASAHPGHDGHDHNGGYTIIHYFTTPYHLALTLMALVVVAVFIRNLRKQRQKI